LDNLLWRQGDCKRNSVSSLTLSVYSQKEAHGKDIKQQLQMQRNKGVELESQPLVFRYGALAKNRFYEKHLENAEIEVVKRKETAVFSADLSSGSFAATLEWLLIPVLPVCKETDVSSVSDKFCTVFSQKNFVE